MTVLKKGKYYEVERCTYLSDGFLFKAGGRSEREPILQSNESDDK